MKRRHDLFPELEPPQGGTTRLMARIDSEQRRLRVRAGFLASAAGLATAVVAIFIALRPAPPVDRSWMEAPAVMALGVGATQSEPLRVAGDVAALRVPTSDPKVVFYLVGSPVSAE